MLWRAYWRWARLSLARTAHGFASDGLQSHSTPLRRPGDSAGRLPQYPLQFMPALVEHWPRPATVERPVGQRAGVGHPAERRSGLECERQSGPQRSLGRTGRTPRRPAYDPPILAAPLPRGRLPYLRCGGDSNNGDRARLVQAICSVDGYHESVTSIPATHNQDETTMRTTTDNRLATQLTEAIKALAFAVFCSTFGCDGRPVIAARIASWNGSGATILASTARREEVSIGRRRSGTRAARSARCFLAYSALGCLAARDVPGRKPGGTRTYDIDRPGHARCESTGDSNVYAGWRPLRQQHHPAYAEGDQITLIAERVPGEPPECSQSG
jgi:hypothetical protein